MDVMCSVFFFVLGVLIGSFLNVVIFRYHSGLKATKGRSICFSCGKTLHWYELVPVLSYVFLRGRCSKCKVRISIQYPLVELLTAFVFLLVYYQEGLTIFLPIQLAIWSVLIAILVYDIRHMIIPDGMVVVFVALAFINLFLKFFFLGVDSFSLFNWFAGLLLFIPFYLLWLFSYGKWIGLGDGKLAIGIGTLLGLLGGIAGIMMAFWIGAIISIMLLVISHLSKNRHVQNILKKYFPRGITIKSEIPFAPFLIIGTFLAYYYGIDYLSLSLSILNF